MYIALAWGFIAFTVLLVFGLLWLWFLERGSPRIGRTPPKLSGSRH